MKLRDFIILMVCCLCWGSNFVVSSWVIGGHNIPPMFLAFVRAAIVLLVMAPFLFKKLPEHFWRLILVCLFIGPLHLAFLYTGLITAPASSSSIVAQMLIPFATVLSMIFLREKVGIIRGGGILGALIGVIIMVYKPGAADAFDIGLIYIMIAYLFLAIGSILMKSVGAIDWKVYVAWMAVSVFITMGIATAAFETEQISLAKNALWPLLCAAGFAGIFVSIFAHGQYFRLIQNYDVTVIVPLTLMVPVFATALGVSLLGEPFDKSFILGAALILPSVFIIAKRQNFAPVQED